MDDAARTQRLEAYRRLCREQGQRCTVQRQTILETVLDLDDHPTADQIYEIVERKIPSVSRTTVYRALENLAHMGLITKACHPGSAVRYDRRVEIHHHLICLRCGGITDITDAALDSLNLPDTSGFGFEVQDFRVQLRGICRRCREKTRRED